MSSFFSNSIYEGGCKIQNSFQGNKLQAMRRRRIIKDIRSAAVGPTCRNWMEIHSFIYCYASRNPYYPEADYDSQLDTNVQACHDFRIPPAIVRITGSYFFFFLCLHQNWRDQCATSSAQLVGVFISRARVGCGTFRPGLDSPTGEMRAHFHASPAPMGCNCLCPNLACMKHVSPESTHLINWAGLFSLDSQLVKQVHIWPKHDPPETCEAQAYPSNLLGRDGLHLRDTDPFSTQSRPPWNLLSSSPPI